MQKYELMLRLYLSRKLNNPTFVTAVSVSLAQSYFYLTYLIGEKLSEENFQTMQTYFDELQKLGKIEIALSE